MEMKRKQQKRRISFQCYICAVASVVWILLVFVCVITIGRTAIEKGRQLATQTAMVQFDTVAGKVQNEIDSVVKLCAYFSETKRIEQYVSISEGSSSTLYQRYQASEEIKRILNLVINQNRSVKAIGVLTDRNCYGCGDVLETQSGLETLQMLCKHSLQEGILLSYPDGEEGLYCNFALQYDGTRKLQIVMLVDDSFLSQPSPESFSWAVFNETGFPFFGDDAKREQANELWRQWQEHTTPHSDYLFQRTLSGTNWTLLYRMPDALQSGLLVQTLQCFVGMIVPSLLLFVVLAYALGRYVSQPIYRFLNRLWHFKRTSLEETEKRYKAVSVRESIWGFLLVTTLVPAIVFCALYVDNMGHVMQKQAFVSRQTTLENKAQDLSAVLSEKKRAIARVVYDERVLQSLVKNEDESVPISAIQIAVEENVYFSLDDGDVDIYNLFGDLVYSNNLFAPKQMEMTELACELGWTIKKNKLGDTRLVLTLRNIELSRYRTLGYTCLSYDCGKILGDVDTLNSAYSQFEILNQGGEVVFPLQSTETTEEKSRWLSATVNGTEWTLRMENVQADSFAKIFIEENQIFLQFFFLLMIVGEYMLSHLLIRPVSASNWAMKHFEPGNPEMRLDEDSFINEIGELNRSFNDMADRIDDLIDDIIISHQYAEKVEQERKNAEITALQMQINPHFLSNTIEMISSTIDEGKTNQAQNMLLSLNNLFRYGISRKEYLIPIHAEVENSRAYVEIMKMRYAGIRFEWNVDQTLLSFYTIKLLLQPLIENAIYHGLYKAGREGVVNIQVIWHPLEGTKKIRFSVSDNGCGMHEEQLSNLRRKLNAPSESGRIGLYNVQSRLRLHYGMECILNVESKWSEGTTVFADIPVRQSNEGGEY